MYSLGTGYECRHSYENICLKKHRVFIELYTEGIFDIWRQSGQPKYAKNEEWFAIFDCIWLYI